jgi:hypothetical protein
MIAMVEMEKLVVETEEVVKQVVVLEMVVEVEEHP